MSRPAFAATFLRWVAAAPLLLSLVACGAAVDVAGKAAGEAAIAGPAVANDGADVCSDRQVPADGKCTQANAAADRACESGDEEDCVAQCDRGNGESCNTLGLMAWHDKGLAKEPESAARFFARSCELAWGEGCANFSAALSAGLGVAKDPAKAVHYAVKACHRGVARACTSAGIHTLHGADVPADPSRALDLIRAGCDRGDQDGCNTLGSMILGRTGGLTYDARAAADLFKGACDGGVMMACTNLGYMIEFAKGVPKDQRQAADLYERACRAEPALCIVVGILEQGAIDRAYDPQKARAAFQASCAAPGDRRTAAEPVACVVLNEFFGEKLPVDQALLRMGTVGWGDGCATGGERDCTMLGVSALGLGDLPAARQFVAEGCRLGDPWACSLRRHPKLK